MATPNSFRAPAHPTRTLEELDDSPPPYTLNPTDEITLELGPTRPFQRPPQQPPLQQQHSAQPPSELSDFAREFYAAGAGVSRSAEDLPQRPPPRHLQTQNSIPDDGKPTRTPVPGHPLLNNGRTLVYPAGYECDKCLSLPLRAPFAFVDDAYQATTPVTNPTTPPTHAADAGINTPNLIRDPSFIPLGTSARPIDRDLS